MMKIVGLAAVEAKTSTKAQRGRTRQVWRNRKNLEGSASFAEIGFVCFFA